MVQEIINNNSRTVVFEASRPSGKTTMERGATFRPSSLDLSLGCVQSTRLAVASLQANPHWAACITNVVIRHGNSSSCRMSSSSQPTSNKGTPAGTAGAAAAVVMSSLEMVHLFGALSALCPQIEALEIALDTETGPRPGCPPMALPVSALTAFFEQSPSHLTSLKISAPIMTLGGPQDFVHLQAAIQDRAPSCWKEVRLEFCEPASGTPSLDPLIQALAAAPQLERLALSGTNVTHTNLCTGPSLVKLINGKSSSLKTLTIWGGKRHINEEDVRSLITSLERNTSLTELTIHAKGVSPAIGLALARCLRVNKTLERLILNVQDNTNPLIRGCSDYVTTTTYLARALQGNRTLRLLSLDYSPEDNDMDSGDSHDYHEHQVLDNKHKSAMRRNAKAISSVFTEMLHCNPVLEVLWMSIGEDIDEEEANDDEDDNDELEEEEEEEEDDATPSSSLLTPEMDMLLRLNRYGIRRNLLETEDAATSNDWMDALASQSYDLNALFYLVSKNPSLCSNSYSSVKKRCATTASKDGDLEANRAPKRQKTTTI